MTQAQIMQANPKAISEVAKKLSPADFTDTPVSMASNEEYLKGRWRWLEKAEKKNMGRRLVIPEQMQRYLQAQVQRVLVKEETCSKARSITGQGADTTSGNKASSRKPPVKIGGTYPINCSSSEAGRGEEAHILLGEGDSDT